MKTTAFSIFLPIMVFAALIGIFHKEAASKYTTSTFAVR
jgi:hypothetical membrane protein